MVNRNKITVVVAEFLAAATLGLILLSVMRSQLGALMLLGLTGAIAVGALAYGMQAYGRVHINPALTLALWTVRKNDTIEAAARIGAQMLGGLVAWTLYEYVTSVELQSVVQDEHSWQLFTIEALGAGILAFIVASVLTSDKMKDANYGLLMGLAYGTGLMVASAVTVQGIANPSVALAFQAHSWTYLAAPLLGAVVGANVANVMTTGMPAFKMPSRSSLSSAVGSAKKSASKASSGKKKSAKK